MNGRLMFDGTARSVTAREPTLPVKRVLRMNLFYGVVGRVGAILACSALFTGVGQSSGAQARRRNAGGPAVRAAHHDRAGQAASGKEVDLPLRDLGETVAVVPWNYKNSRDAAVQSAHEVCSQLLLGTGFNVYLIKTAAGAMPPPMTGISGSKRQESAFSHLLGMGHSFVTQDAPNKVNSVFVLPTLDEMIAIGLRLHPRYVLAGRAQWRSRNVWIGVSNRIKSICTVDIEIVDMTTRQLVLDAHGVEGDSTENKNLYNAFTNVMALNPLPLVMPGSIGPYEQHAVTVAIARAMHPWLKTERIRAALAQADQSTAEAEAGRSLPRFSTLLSAISDFQAALHVTTPDGKAPELGDRELSRIYALHDVTLQYKAPDQLRLTANSPKDGPETLLIKEDQRSLTVGEGRKVAQHDFGGSPSKRSFLFEFCGILTPGIFDTMRARFVKQETLNGVPTQVYDLTYWGMDGGPYHRVWIDPARRLIVKREYFDADSKLKSIVLYKQPMEIHTTLWIPEAVEIQDGVHKPLATIRISRPQANQGIADSVFTPPVP
jgi:outer membrane lipoprotein-sorting protein